MSNAVAVIPDNLPAYLQGGDFNANEEAISNLSLGGFPYIKLNGTRFQAVEGDNEHNLAVLELPVVIMRAAPALRKKWYATKYNPNSVDPNKKPDCFSDDGVAPHALSVTPQSKTCAACPHNAFGSGRDQDGKPTDGKACSDNKQLAVFTQAPIKAGAENSVFGLRLPPASLKNFALYVKSLTSKRVPLAAALTIVGFDQNSSYPILTFRFGGLLNEQQYARITELSQGDEVVTIITPTPGGHAAPATAQAAAAQPAAKQEVSLVDDLGLDDPAPIKTEAKAQPKPEPEPKPAPEPAAAAPSDLDDMFGDLSPAPAASASAQPAQAAQGEATLVDENDDDLARELGLI